MKSILLVFLVLPNVFCFIISSSSRRWKAAKLISKGLEDMCVSEIPKEYIGKIVCINNNGRCKDKFRPILLTAYDVVDEKTGKTRTIQPVECAPLSGKEMCHDIDAPARSLYSCKPIIENICLRYTGSLCYDHVHETVGCDCRYRHIE